MLDERIDPAEVATPRGLRSAYRAALASVVETVGPERAARRSGVDADRLARLGSGDADAFALSEVAAVLALSPAYPDRETVAAELRDDLVVGLSNAALDADAVARSAGPDVDGETVRAAAEGSRDVTLATYARIRHVVATEGRA